MDEIQSDARRFPGNPDPVAYKVMTDFLKRHGYSHVEPDARMGRDGNILSDLPDQPVSLLRGVAIEGDRFVIKEASGRNPEVVRLKDWALMSGLYVIYTP